MKKRIIVCTAAANDFEVFAQQRLFRFWLEGISEKRPKNWAVPASVRLWILPAPGEKAVAVRTRQMGRPVRHSLLAASQRGAVSRGLASCGHALNSKDSAYGWLSLLQKVIFKHNSKR